MTNSTQQLLKAFDSLSDDEQAVMIIMSVVYDPIGQGLLQDIASAIKSDDGTRYLDKVVSKPFRDKLHAMDLNSAAGTQYCCPAELLENLSRRAVLSGRYGEIYRVVDAIYPNRSYYSKIDHRAVRNLVHLNRFDDLCELIQAKPSERIFNEGTSILTDICFADLDEEWFLQLNQGIQLMALYPVQDYGFLRLSSEPTLLPLLQRCCRELRDPHPDFFCLLIRQHIFRGELTEAKQLLTEHAAQLTQSWPKSLEAIMAFFNGDNQAALTLFDAAITLEKKQRKKRKVALLKFEGLFHILALLKTQQEPQLTQAKGLVKIVLASKPDENLYLCFLTLDAIIEFLQDGTDIDLYMKQYTYIIDDVGRFISGPYLALIWQLIYHWLDKGKYTKLSPFLKKSLKKAAEANLHWYANEASLALQITDQDSKDVLTKKKPTSAIYPLADIVPLTQLIKPVPEWSRSLMALQSMAAINEGKAQDDQIKSKRLAWLIDPYNQTLSPKEQARNKNGSWTKGRAVALKRLYGSRNEFSYLTLQDHKICDCIVEQDDYSGWSGYNNQSYEISQRGLIEAAGHPSLSLREAPSDIISLTANPPELAVKKTARSLTLSLNPFPQHEDARLSLHKVSGRVWQITQFDAQHFKIANILSFKGLKVPIEAKQQVLESIGAIAPMLTVHSDIGGGDNSAEDVAADSRLHIHLQPESGGLNFQFLCRPLGEQGPSFRPGEGGETIFAEVAGKRLQTTRNIKLEKSAVKSLAKNCSFLQTEDSDELVLEDPQEALAALEYLQDHEDDFVIAWPKGKSMNLSTKLDIPSMQISVGGQQKNWFALDGSLKVDNGQVIQLENLLQLVQETPGRFLKMDDSQFISLSEQLHKRLLALSALASGKRLHLLASASFDEFTDGMLVKQSTAWKKQLKSIHAAYALEVSVPPTLQTELRAYQFDGFRWMMQLAHWGAGACLADDMGLGKTIQALALILTRASEGPTLVLAPTSVCINWLEEVVRFAPTLTVQHFGRGDRLAMLEQAGPFDLIVCSYGLLQTEIDKLEKTHFQTIVADEAQALKNANTKRSKAALRLDGAFKIITTGTPIENHLGELWSLFRFINPGLLGSLTEFNADYAVPIEGNADLQAQQRLKTLVKPFILRRLKSEVLTELPARTEITITVEPSKEEAAFYEAIRRQAVKQIEDEDGAGGQGQKKFRVLAEITRLRRACCNPRLLVPELNIDSAKLNAFVEIVDELRENNHRALVFSQFVGHLKLLQESLDAKEIPYQYLDGSTSLKKRQQAVNRFQNGEGDLFLISLKAGGSGLNLTAADYVVHMDPWWNPAVEDQASDRAHRIGQTRPVTVYRVVMGNSIEEKILSLHRKKRDLADSLLEGTEAVSGKLELDEMLSLLKV